MMSRTNFVIISKILDALGPLGKILIGRNSPVVVVLSILGMGVMRAFFQRYRTMPVSTEKLIVFICGGRHWKIHSFNIIAEMPSMPIVLTLGDEPTAICGIFSNKESLIKFASLKIFGKFFCTARHNVVLIFP